MNTNFQDPRQHDEVIDDHMRLVRFIKKLGCDHLKINCGRANPGGNTPEIYRNMAAAFNDLGRRISDMGIQFGIHHHLWNQYEKREDVDAIMELTDPRHVYMILDTGHTTMAGMDPVRLTRDYVSRIIEFHMKDCAPENRGGYKGPYMERGTVNTNKDNLIFFPLGKGGVDYPAHQEGTRRQWMERMDDRRTRHDRNHRQAQRHRQQEVPGSDSRFESLTPAAGVFRFS